MSTGTTPAPTFWDKLSGLKTYIFSFLSSIAGVLIVVGPKVWPQIPAEVWAALLAIFGPSAMAASRAGTGKLENKVDALKKEIEAKAKSF